MIPGLTLSGLPAKFKWLVTLVLFSFLLNHAFSFWLIWEVTTNVDAGAKEHFAYKTLAVLLRMAHQHTFGHGTMFFLTGAIFLMAEFPETLALAIVTAAFLGAHLDLFSWFMLKYYSEKWEMLSVVAGCMYSLSFAAMAGVSLYQMWWRRPQLPRNT